MKMRTGLVMTLVAGGATVGAQTAGPADWSRVRALTGGTEIVVTAAGSEAVHVRFASADDRGITVTTRLRTMERIPREKVRLLEIPETKRDAVACGIASYLGGAAIGGVPGAVVGGAIGKDTGPALTGMLVGWTAGGAYLFGKCRHVPARIVYEAPPFIDAVPAVSR
jgi:hypothetical protein